MFVLYRTTAAGREALAVSNGIQSLWEVVLNQKHNAKDRRSLGNKTTRDDFVGGEEIHLTDCIYRIARVDVV
jgi:hypothetical protein